MTGSTLPMRNAARLLLILVLMIAAVPIGSVADAGSQLYIGHRARLTAQIPADWRVSAEGWTDYHGPDGFVSSTPLAQTTLDEACVHLGSILNGGSTPATWQGEDACHIDGAINSRPAMGLVLPHPAPFSDGADDYRFAAVVADPAHFPSIIASLHFDPNLVTPQAYVDSVLDLMEARAWYADAVDWDTLRDDPLGLIANADTWEETHWLIRDALTHLRYAGDTHSLFVAQGATLHESEREGFGMLIDGPVVMLVYPDGPAAHAGIRTGDTIVSVDGQAFVGFPVVADPSYAWAGSVTLTIRRPGVTEPMPIELDPRTYRTYLPPIARSLPGAIGYIELFTTVGADRVQYATDATTGIARVDATGACGWIVDLRRNTGGGYRPMVTGVGPIVGDGTILTFVNRAGEVVITIAYQDGRIIQNGEDISGDLSDVPKASLQYANQPVAVLIGPYTASAGEVTALVFVDRPQTRLFGEPSGGYTVGNTGYMLFDGAVLALAELADGDRTGTPYVDGIEPDVEVSADWTVYGTADDPAIQAASTWLNHHPACATLPPALASPETR